MLASLVPRLLPLTMLALMAMLCARALDLARALLPESASGAAMAAEPAAITPAPSTGAPVAPLPAAPAPVASASVTPVASASVNPVASAPVAPVAPAPVASAPPPHVPKAAEAPPPAASLPEPRPEPPVSESERALLLDLRKRRLELDARESAIVAREDVLAAAQTRLSVRLDELRDLQRRLESLESARSARDEANWRGLVKLYETMKPKDAAAIFNDLDASVLLPVLDRMKEAKAAAILAAMLPDRARSATTELARLRAQANAVPPAAAQAAPVAAGKTALPN